MDAFRIAKALNGHLEGQNWIAHCPAHDDKSPSLSIRNSGRKVLVYCFAGCSQQKVIEALQEKGLWAAEGRKPCEPSSPIAAPAPAPAPAPGNSGSERRMSDYAEKIWRTSEHAGGTLAETYLATRSLPLPASASLRFCKRLKHKSGQLLPCMIGLVQGGASFAIHRTFLAQDGSGKASVAPQKMMLGSCNGGTVRLAEAEGSVMIGEGIETCLAAMELFDQPAWAALSATNLQKINLPAHIRQVTLLADGDAPGVRAAQICAEKMKAEGRQVQLRSAPEGMDFNDVLLRQRTSLPSAENS